MALYRNVAFVADRWRIVDEGEAVPAAGHVIFTFDWWLAERGAFEGSNIPVGLLIEPATRLEEIAGDIHRFALIALKFPKFQDGRAFSLAQLLRERHGFQGELRAVGEVLIDQIQPMMRCGFDSFEINDPVTERALREGRIPAVSHFYQPAFGKEVPAGARPWIRRPAD